MSTLNRILVRTLPLVVSLGMALPCTAARLRVPNDYPTVQLAVDAAMPGDVIALAFQLHYGSVVIENKSSIEIRGTSGLIYPNPQDSIGVHILNSTDITLHGFEIRGFERAIVIEDSTDCTVKQMTIHNNRDQSSGNGSFLADGVVLINADQNDITQNAIFHNGSNGILLTEGSSANTIRGNRLEDNGWQIDNAEDAGSGVALDGGDQQDNMIVGNTIKGNNWGILLGGDGASSGNQISRNKSNQNARAGIALRGGAANDLVKGNSAAGNNTAGLDPSNPYDIFDDSSGDGNTFVRNKGSIGP